MTSKTPITDKAAFPVIDADTDECTHAVPVRVAEKLETELAEARAEIERLNKQLDEFWEHLDYSWAIEPRAELEKIAKESWNPPNPLLVALHYIWKREAKTPEKDKLIEQMREALKKLIGTLEIMSVMPETLRKRPVLTMDAPELEQARAALEAAERGE